MTDGARGHDSPFFHSKTTGEGFGRMPLSDSVIESKLNGAQVQFVITFMIVGC